jgi:hypothetical protein
MAQIAIIIGAAALFVGGFFAWYTLWHRRLESAFERVPVADRRAAHLVRRDSVEDNRG